MPPFLRRLFSRKIAARVAFTLAALITLIFALRAFENWRGARAWAAYRADAEKRGVRLWLSDFVPPPVPDAENFAANPIIQEIFAASDANAEVPNPFAWPTDHRSIATSLPNRDKGEHMDFAKVRDALREAKLLAQPTDNPALDVLSALASYEPALQQFRDAARRPRSRFPVKWEDGFMARIPHLTTMQSASRLIMLRMSAHLALRENAAALGDWRDGLGLYRALEREPVLISGLVRIAILRGLVNTVSEGVGTRQWAEPELRAISADLASLNLLADLRFAIASERGGMNAYLDAFTARNPVERTRELQVVGAAGPGSSSPLAIGGLLYPNGWVRQSQVKMNQIYDRDLGRVDVEKGVFLPGPSGDDELFALKQGNIVTKLTYIYAAILMPALNSLENIYAAAHTTNTQTRTACALELFRRVRGAFPERLDELVPDFLDAIPRDVMDGAPLRYRRTADGKFELWSIGANRKDDDAKSDPAKSARDQPDWVWRP